MNDKKDNTIMPQTDSNPYKGPDPFEAGDLLFGRDREAKTMLSLLVTSPVVLLYAPSGAGKTSLVNAKLCPDLEREKGFEVLPPTRVVSNAREGIGGIHNIYVFNTLLYLDPDVDQPIERVKDGLCNQSLDLLKKESLVDFMRRKYPLEDHRFRPRVLIFDQFEEILTAYPERRNDREGFFLQLREALASDPQLNVLLVMREDHIAGLDRYAALLPSGLRTRFHMQRLKKEAALEAVRRPALEAGRPFADGVAEELVDNLRQEHLADQEKTIAGEFVEPVQLQVVCLKLWEGLAEKPGDVITRKEVKAGGDVDQTLGNFYEEIVKRTASAANVSEISIYRFFATTLITPARIRGQVSRGAQRTGELPNLVIDLLLHEHLIRREEIRGGIWYELVHDRFIDPIRGSYEKKRRAAQRFRLLTATLLIAMVGIAGWLYHGYERASRHSQALADDALDLLDTKPQESLKKALEAARVTYDVYHTTSPKAEKALHEALNAARGRLLWDVQHTDAIETLALSMDGRRLAAAGADGAVKVWDVESGLPLASFNKGADKIIGLDFSPGGDRLATLGLDKITRVWKVSRSQEQLAISGNSVNTISFNPDGTRLVTAGEDGTVKFWNALSGAPGRSLSSYGDAVYALAFKPDGSRLATVDEDAMVRIRNIDSGTEIRTITGPIGGLNVVFFSPTGKRFATAGVDNTVKVWELDSGDLYRTFPRFALDAIFSQAGTSLVIATNEGTTNDNGTLSIWDLESSKATVIIRDKSQWEQAAFSPTGRRLSTASETSESGVWSIKVWEYSFDYASSLAGHARAISALGFSPHGEYLATLSVDRTAKLWSVDSGREAFDLAGNLGPIEALAFSPDGRRLATVGEDFVASLWDVDTWDVDTWDVDTWDVHQLFGHGGWIEDIDFSPDGKLLATASWDGTAKVWDARSGTEICTFNGHSTGTKVWAVAFNPDGSSVATASDEGPPKVWDKDCGEIFSLEGHDKPVRALAFSPNGKRLATASADRTVRVWQAHSGEEILALRAHSQEVQSVSFSPDGKRLATGGMDRTVRLWDADSGEELFKLPGNVRAVRDLAFSPDGKRLAIASAGETVRIEFLAIADLIELASRRIGKPSISETEHRKSPDA